MIFYESLTIKILFANSRAFLLYFKQSYKQPSFKRQTAKGKRVKWYRVETSHSLDDSISVAFKYNFRHGRQYFTEFSTESAIY